MFEGGESEYVKSRPLHLETLVGGVCIHQRADKHCVVTRPLVHAVLLVSSVQI